MRFRYADGGCGLSTATRSGRARKPCPIRPNVPGKAPPPCANAIRRRGRRSRTPPEMTEQMASETSAGMPTSQGSQYFRILASPIMSQGWTKIAASNSAARANTGNRAASERFQSFTWEPICTPARPSWTQRSSSRTARSGDCSASGSTCVCTSRLRMLAAALATGRVRRVTPVVLEHRRELLDDVGEVERFPVQLATAAVADPEEGVLLPRQPAPLDHQPHRVGRALRGVGRVRREQEDLAFPDGNVDALSSLQRAQHHVAFHLV